MVRHLRAAGVGWLVVTVLGCVAGCGKQPIALVGQHKITRAEFLAKLEKDQGHEALAGMINRLLVEDAFVASGLTLKAETVDERIKEMKDRFPSPEAFNQALTSRGMTEQDLKDTMAMELKLRELCMKDVKVTEQKVREFFEQYKEHFKQPETVSYSEIVVTSEADAKKVAAELAKPGANFSALAKQYSVSPATRDMGGKVPETARERVAPDAVRQALAQLKPGQVSAPFAGEEGRWIIVKLDQTKAAMEADFTRDRKKIEETFKEQQAKQPQELLAELREKSVVNVVEPRYADMNEMFRPKAALPQFGGKAPGAKGAPGATPAAPAGATAPAQTAPPPAKGK